MPRALSWPGGTLDGPAYERWVAGYDVETGQPKGRLRTDAHGLRFVEVVVNGPIWSLAAALHPEIAAAYDAAQDQAAVESIGWLAQHATPRGRHVQVRVERIEAAPRGVVVGIVGSVIWVHPVPLNRGWRGGV